MNNELTIYPIEGNAFQVDVMKEMLIEVAQPTNVIRFADMDFNGSFYSFNYDPVFKNIHSPFDDYDDVVQIRVPLMMELDPERMAQKYKIDLEQCNEAFKVILMVHEQAFVERLRGTLPELRIGNRTYLVDLADWRFRPKYHTDLPDIPTKVFSMLKDGQTLACLYEDKTGNTYNMHSNPDSLPRGLQLLSVKPMVRLDPIGMARLNRLDDFYFAREIGPQSAHTASLQPVTKLQLKEIQGLHSDNLVKEQMEKSQRKGQRI